MSRYATAEHWALFLKPINAAVRNPQDRPAFLARCAACADALAVFPEWLTEGNRRAAMARFEFWPSVAEIGGLFDTERAHGRFMQDLAERRALPPPDSTGPSAEERASIAQQMRDLAAHLRSSEHGGEPPKVTPAYLRADQLRAHYAQLAEQGNQAAKVRLAVLDKAMDAATS